MLYVYLFVSVCYVSLRLQCIIARIQTGLDI